MIVEQSLFYFSRSAPKVFTFGLGLLILTVQSRFLVSSSHTVSAPVRYIYMSNVGLENDLDGTRMATGKVTVKGQPLVS